MARDDHDAGRDARADSQPDWTWSLEDTIGERVNDALRHWVEGLEHSLAHGNKEQE